MEIKDLLLFGVGIVAGSMNAIAGGGMLVGFPALLTYGLSALTANATGCVIVLPGLITSAFGYRDYLRKVPKKYLWLLVPCVAGSAIGATILKHTTGNQFEMLVPWLLLLAVTLFAYQPPLQAYLRSHLRSRAKAIKPLFVIGLALFPVSIYGGYFGAGLGFIMLAFLSFTKIHDIHQMNAMKNVAGIAMCIVSIFVLSNSSLINWHAGIVMAVGTGIGGYGGARFARRVPSHAIRIIVIALGLFTAAYIAFKYH